jgi:DNA-binding CsgD family transcriptional regulator
VNGRSRARLRGPGRSPARRSTAPATDWSGPRAVAAHRRAAGPEEAYRCAARISRPGQLASHVPTVLYVALDLVEACTRTHRQAAAAAHVAAMETAGIAAISPRLRLVVTGCAAIVAEDEQVAIDRFSRALAIAEAERWPFDLARIQLLYGERLRRTGAAGQARAQLQAALERFQWLGARPWNARAREELRATGQTSLLAMPSAAARLTPRERQIAALAASGLRNKQIAETLVLSERTVAAHLHRAFPTLPLRLRLSVVLVYGPFGDAAHWSEFIPLLADRGLPVVVARCPLTSPSDDVAAVRSVLDQQAGDAVLVAHSWDGAVITEACGHPRVRGAIYIASGPDGQLSLGDWLNEFPVVGDTAAPGDWPATGTAWTWPGKPTWFIYGEQVGQASPSEAPMPAHLAQVADVVAQAAADLAGQGTW